MIRYFGDYVISTLQYARLKVAKPRELNDPFDFNIKTVFDVDIETCRKIANSESAISTIRRHCPEFVDATPKERAKFLLEWDGLSDFVRAIDANTNPNDNFRLLCFCNPDKLDSSGDILMWSHYGNEHRGFRIHFSEETFSRVSSVCKLVKYPPTKQRVMFNIEERFQQESYIKKAKEAYFIKGVHWEYEQEIRMILTPSQCSVDIQTNMEFLNFDPQFLKRIDIGMHAPDSLKSKLSDLLTEERYQHVEIWQAEIHETLFDISYNQISVEELKS